MSIRVTVRCLLMFWVLRGMRVSKVEARKLEHHYPHALKVKYKGS